MSAVLGELWRVGLTLVALLALVGFWALVLPNLTPFAQTFTSAQAEAEKQRETRFRTIRKVSVGLDVLFFVWLVVEGALLVPWLLARYGIA